MNISYRAILFFLCACVMGCNADVKHKNAADTTKPNVGHVEKMGSDVKMDTVGQLKLVKKFVTDLKSAIVKNNTSHVAGMIYFPLQTQPRWSDASLKDMKINEAEGLIDKEAYLKQYGQLLFDKERRRILNVTLNERDILPVNLKTDEASNYYQSLARVTDPNTLLFNYYLQWAKPDGRGDYWFGLVIGKVKGEYKVISYYSLWPLKS